MSNFFRQTSLKIVTSILCVLCLFAALISGFLVLKIASMGGYYGNTNFIDSLAKDQTAQDAASIMLNYFDPSEPDKPWKSYYSGGIYTGEDSNFRYDIIDDETGYSVLSTVEGGEPIRLKTQHNYSFEVEDAVPTQDALVLSEPMFCVGSTLFAYDAELNCFDPVYEGSAKTLSDSILELPEDVYDTGFTYASDGGSYSYDDSGSYEIVITNHYAFNGTGFEESELTTAYSVSSHDYTIVSYVLQDLSASDRYRTIYQFGASLNLHRYDLIAILVVSLILGLAMLTVLCVHVGLPADGTEPRLNPVFRIPTDIGLLCAFFLMCCGGAGLGELFYDFASLRYLKMGVMFLLIPLFPMGLVYGLSLLCARGRTHSIFSGCIIVRLWRKLKAMLKWAKGFCIKALGYLPLLWKVAVCYLAICFVEFVFMVSFSYCLDGALVFFWFVEKLLLGALVGYVALCLRRLKNGAESIAAGDYTTRVEEEHLVMDFKDCANTLNHIQGGMNAAVESRMKSERLKTELITNVSHDIKTPLTSIISYVDLLKKEPAGSPAAGEYLEVLDRQSARLKKLVEDLVEASKASTGNITVHAEPMDLGVILGQALGEYNERLLNADLTPVLKLPENPVTISADGRLLWRIFDNLLGNAVKYAMPGTRLYVTLNADSHAIVTFRNVSREALDVSADELMERFVRGDASRHTEGSGLGLSIAKSLAESMGGQFLLSVDGDLFKAAVIFPVISSQN